MVESVIWFQVELCVLYYGVEEIFLIVFCQGWYFVDFGQCDVCELVGGYVFWKCQGYLGFDFWVSYQVGQCFWLIVVGDIVGCGGFQGGCGYVGFWLFEVENVGFVGFFELFEQCGMSFFEGGLVEVVGGLGFLCQY